jgi:hypothetical protein
MQPKIKGGYADKVNERRTPPIVGHGLGERRLLLDYLHLVLRTDSVSAGQANQFDAREAGFVRIPGHADQRSGVMVIRVPGSCRSGFWDDGDHDSGLMPIKKAVESRNNDRLPPG